MLEALLGPDVHCCFSGSPEILASVRAAIDQSDGEVRSELDQQLMTIIREAVEEFLVRTEYEHDGYLLSWELLSIGEFEGELSLTSSFNLSVKADDFDFFNDVLNNDRVLGWFLERIQQTIRDFLQSSGVPTSDLQTQMKSDGFGYG